MTAQDMLAQLEKLADEYANCAAKARLESLYGTSKSYTAECQREENEARSQLVKALAEHEAQAPAVPFVTSDMVRASLNELKQQHQVVPSMYAMDAALNAALAAAPQPEAVQVEPLAQAVVDAARAAMDESVESFTERMDIIIPGHLAAALSLRLDEYDRAHGIRSGK